MKQKYKVKNLNLLETPAFKLFREETEQLITLSVRNIKNPKLSKI